MRMAVARSAGVAIGGLEPPFNPVSASRIADSSDDDWRGVLERNLIQTVRMMRLALPHMKGRPGAAVINIASISGWRPQLAMSGQYGAAKAALIFDTERWALEFVPYRIRVNTVSPGSILIEGNGWDRYRLANPTPRLEPVIRTILPVLDPCRHSPEGPPTRH